MEVWHRFEDRLTAPPVDEFDNICGESQLHVYYYTFPVVKVTEKGVWLNVYGSKRFVLTDARKRFATPTVEEAFTSFKARKDKQIRIYTSKIQNAKHAINLAEKKINEIYKREQL